MRDFRLDNIRAVAIVLVIMVHAWSLSGIDESSQLLLGRLYHCLFDCGVPLFVMLSGALLLSAPITSLSEFYKKRVKRILVPFFIWGTLVYILSACLGKYPDVVDVPSALLYFIPYLLENKVNYAYWYIQLILVLYLLTPFLQMVVKSISRKALAASIVGLLALLAIRQLFPSVYFVNYTSALLPHILYFLFGYFAYTYWKKLPRSKVYLALLIFLLAFFGYAFRLMINAFWVALECMSLFVMLYHCLPKENTLMRYMSDTSYAVYLTHFLLIASIYKAAIFFSPESHVWLCALMPLAVSLLVELLCLIFFYPIKRWCPFSRWLGL